MTIRATFPAAAVTAADATPGARTIAGTAVPWNVVGYVADGTPVVFHPGSLDATARPHLLRDHDPTRPLGLVIDATDTGTGMTATARVSRHDAGNEAIMLAADGVLGMFSVGADPSDFRYDPDGTMHVYAADWRELSLLTMGAYTDARVATVTASQPAPGGAAMPDLIDTDTDPDTPDELDVPDDDKADDDDETTSELLPVVAGRAALVPLRAAAGARRPVGLDLRGAATIIAAGLSQKRSAPRIQAALTNVTTTNAVPPVYRSQLVPLIDPGMPLVNELNHAEMPPYGMRIEYPTWTAPPAAYAIQAAEKTQIASGPVTMGTAHADIETWAQGNDISFQLAMRSDPSFIEQYLAACAIDAGRKYDTHVATAILAGATAATLPTTVTFVNCVAALYAALNPLTTPPGPMFVAMSYDVYVGAIGVTGLNGPAFWGMNLNLGEMTPGVTSTPDFVVDANLPAKTMILGSKNAATTYGGPSTSADVRVVDVGLLGYDIGVYFFAALAITYPTGFAKLTGVTLPPGDDPAPTGKTSK